MAEDNKRVLKPVANVHERKKSLVDKFAGVFFSSDARSVAETIFNEWIIPGMKNAAISSIEMLLWGDRRGGRSSSGPYHTSYTSYSRNNTYYDSGRRVASVGDRNGFDYTNYDFASLAEVTQVIDEMTELIRSEYRCARVADLNQLIGISGKYTDQKWGWTDARDFRYRRVGAYYILDFAPPVPLD